MTNIVAISGSLRKGSYNTAMLHAAQEFMPQGSTLTILSIHDLPVFNEDLEKLGEPAAVTALKNKIADADGLLVSTPEYNNGIPGGLKNAIDWISRPGADMPRVLFGKPFALMGATKGGFGTVFSQTAWLMLIRYFRFRPCFANALFVSAAHEKFDESLKLTDEMVSSQLKKFVEDFVSFVQYNSDSKSN